MGMLKGKKALITGGTAGIGKGIALAMAREGAHVVIFGTNQERASLVVAEMQDLTAGSGQMFFYQIVDVADKVAVDKAIQEVLAQWGGVDILVNNAGITKDGLLMKMSEADWDQVLATNLKSVYNTCQSLVRVMLKARSGKIVNISSVVGLTGNAGQTNYAASKAGMIGFTKALALEVASRGICVNCIAPGFIQTKMTDVLNDAQKEGLLRDIPMGKMGVPEDIANAVVFLASPLSDYITGQVLSVDGGMVM
ncbi:MAG: 3-oxoacyl-ACP reductase FabG [Rhabdochlamydiaceae bacterium]|nr:3-oxoacyl-ACP reductase FabG [Rhabdochlamydiaceae bacterium]